MKNFEESPQYLHDQQKHHHVKIIVDRQQTINIFRRPGMRHDQKKRGRAEEGKVGRMISKGGLISLKEQLNFDLDIDYFN
jgi:hypothetical protein